MANLLSDAMMILPSCLPPLVLVVRLVFLFGVFEWCDSRFEFDDGWICPFCFCAVHFTFHSPSFLPFVRRLPCRCFVLFLADAETKWMDKSNMFALLPSLSLPLSVDASSLVSGLPLHCTVRYICTVQCWFNAALLPATQIQHKYNTEKALHHTVALLGS